MEKISYEMYDRMYSFPLGRAADREFHLMHMDLASLIANREDTPAVAQYVYVNQDSV